MRNERTPRTLSECQFWTGYPIVRAASSPSPRWLNWTAAIGIGAYLGYLLARSI